MSADKNLVLEQEDPCNEHICADLAKALGFRLKDCMESCDELHMWTLYDENKTEVPMCLCFYPTSNTVQLTQSSTGNVLKSYKLNILLIEQ